MFGQGNQAPHPRASLQQLPPGKIQPFQQGGHGVPGTGRPVVQHLSYQSGPQVYQTAQMHPHPQSGTPNVGMYVQGTQHNIGNNQAPFHYPPIQQHPQHVLQNLYHVPPPRPSLPPPPPSSHSFQISESLVPPPPLLPPSGPITPRGVSQATQPSGHHSVQHFRSLQQPLLSSVVQRISLSELSSLATENDSHLIFTDPPPPPSLPSCQPPVPLACPPSTIPISDGKQLSSGIFNAASESPSPLPSLRGCPDPVKTIDIEATSGLMLTSHNNDSSVTVASLYNEIETHVSMVNGSVSEILIPEAGSLSQRNSSSGGGLCSTSDSDIDMEDDILNLIEDLETNDSRKDQHHENLVENLDAKQKLQEPMLRPASSTGLPSEGLICVHLLGQPSIMKSPIKVKRGYASDDATEKPCAHSVQEVSFAQPADNESTVLKKIGESNRVSDGESNNHSKAYEESAPVTSEHSLMQKMVTEFGKETALDLKNSSMISVSLNKPSEVAKRDGSKEHSCDESQLPSQAKGRLKRDDMTSKHGKSRAEDTTASLQLKVDEFGRLAKNYSSDSDSDDLNYSRKRGRRGRSRSISPFNRRRKTPPRRRYNRSRSRSYSPSRRRSRSRSPSYRRPTESFSDRRRRDKIQTSICFNFRDGKCHRGSSCRYLHHESDKKGSSNLYKRKLLSDSAHGDKGSNFQEISKEYLGNKGSHRDDKDESHGALPLNSTNFVHPDSGRVNNVTDKNDVSQRITVLDHAELDQDDHTMVSYSFQRKDVGRKSVHVLEATVPQVAQGQNAANPPDDNKHQNSDQSWHPKGLPSLVISSTSMSSKEPLEANRSAAMLQYDNLQPQKSNNSYESISVPHQSLGTPHLLKASDPRQSVPSPSLPSATMGSRFQSMVAENTSSQVPSGVTGTPFSKVTTGPCMPRQNSSLSAMQTATGLPPPFIPGVAPSYNQFSLPNRPPQYNPRQVPIWNSLPPPPPRASIHADTPNAITFGNTIPYHFEQNQQSKKIDVVPQSISGPYSGPMHFTSQRGGHHHYNHHPSVEAHRPPFACPMQMPDSHLIVNSHLQQTEGHHFERNCQTSGQAPSTFHVQLSASFNHPPATGTLPWSETDCHVSSQGDTILNNTSSNDPRNSMPSDSRIFGLPGKIESANLGVSGISEFEYPRTSAHYNMHVSASDRPLALMFSQPQMVGAQGVEAHSLREKSPSSISIRNTGQSFPESGGGQYDPLLDSLEKSSNSPVNSQRINKQHSTGDSENVLKDNVSRKLLDAEETNRKKESEVIASLTTSDNEEFGETEDAEVGPLENESVSNLVDIPNRYSEVAISETYPDKKSKDSRSMKLFKSAIANFVKDVLKPSWRQGNMSKEAFKTIVKKTVEKVSGSVKGHRYPKSEAKINHYIDSSERKLRKLIMGYVDKYVKV